MTFRIPENYIEGFIELNKLPLHLVEEISKTIEEMQIGTGIEEFTGLIHQKVDSEQISRTIYSFGNLLSSSNIPHRELAKEISLKASERIEGIDHDGLTERLNILFSHSNNLRCTFKALKLMSENKSIYYNSRIVSDIRLVFEDDIEPQQVQQAVVVHRLKIETKTSEGEDRDVFIDLDSKDLIQLRDCINRALEKEKHIKENNDQLSIIEFTN